MQHKEKYKVIILVLSSEIEPYKTLTETIKNTWGNNINEDILIIYYYHKPDIECDFFDEKTNSLYIKGEENLLNIGNKTLKSFDFLIKNYTFDFIFRTNSSSYVNIKELLKFIDNKPKNNYVSAIIGTYNNIKFPSGCGYFLSYDIVNKIIENKSLWNHELIDDVALGTILNVLNIPIQNDAKRVDIILESQHYLIDVLNYHYRCKHEHNRNLDIKIINELYIKENRYENI